MQMASNSRIFLPLILAVLLLSGCELIGDLLKLGFWTGVIVVVLVIGVIWAIMRGLRGRPRA